MKLNITADVTVKAPNNVLTLYRALKEDENVLDHIEVVDADFDINFA